jgi:putative DNA-invertase from lambdoid prophage Rac
MAIYGYIRCSPAKNEKSPGVQMEQFSRKALELGGPLAETFIERGEDNDRTAILARPAGKEMLETLKAGDTLIVARLDRLGYSIRDVQKTLATLGKNEVRVYILNGFGGELNLEPRIIEAVTELFTLEAKTNRALRSEQFTELAHRRKEKGLAYGGVPTARRIVQWNGVKVLEWDIVASWVV